MTEKIKTRFAPSPTGLVHLGNVRTALFNALLGKAKNGIFLLRIEDTDKERSSEEYTRHLMEDLRWLGLDWQEGPERDKGNGPYWQSQRQKIYDEYYQQLEQQNLAYPCFCTDQQLKLARKIQLAAGKPPRYSGTCRNLSREQVSQKLAQGIKPTLRFAVPPNQEIIFHDLVRGEQRFKTNDLGDFIIRRTDGTPPFLFCNAIDDIKMQVTHVLRGEDHLANTPRQILIMQALKFSPIPHYGHINLIVGSDGSPLSKRHGSRSVKELREEGFFPEGIVNYLARLGHYYENESYMSFEQLAEKFSIKNLGRSPARFDSNQLLYWQKESLLHIDDEKLWRWMGESVEKLVPENLRNNFLSTVKANIYFPKNAEHWAKVFFLNELNFDSQQKQIIQEAGAEYFKTALAVLDESGADFSAVSDALKTKLNLKGKPLFQPLRVALTGELHGPEMVKIFDLLGKEKISLRLENGLKITKG